MEDGKCHCPHICRHGHLKKKTLRLSAATLGLNVQMIKVNKPYLCHVLGSHNIYVPPHGLFLFYFIFFWFMVIYELSALMDYLVTVVL